MFNVETNTINVCDTFDCLPYLPYTSLDRLLPHPALSNAPATGKSPDCPKPMRILITPTVTNWLRKRHLI